MENFEQIKNKEKGEDVQVVVKFLRHGERDKEGRLTDYGREITAIRAQESGIALEDFDAVKAIGSDAGLKSGVGARALETADIYANAIAGDEVFNTRVNDILSYETLKNPVPYDHVEIYDANLSKNFDTLSDEEKSVEAKNAQTAVINYMISLDTPEAKSYKKEAAGAFAYILDHYKEVASRLNPESKVLIPAGTHGGVMELLLQQALVREDSEGEQVVGFENSEEIGGEFSPSEGYNVYIETDDNGKLGPLRVVFDNPSRQLPEGMYLDSEKVKELADYYKKLHETEKSER